MRPRYFSSIFPGKLDNPDSTCLAQAARKLFVLEPIVTKVFNFLIWTNMLDIKLCHMILSSGTEVPCPGKDQRIMVDLACLSSRDELMTPCR
ncbi:hypothetical protein C0J52_19015 [Blattella germanica]|nr:hypothetical protein C0J52_19015 [Blattella germanica]